MLSMQDFPVDFAAVTTLKWGEGKRKAKMSENEKSSEIDTVSQLFLHGIVELMAQRAVVGTCSGPFLLNSWLTCVNLQGWSL